MQLTDGLVLSIQQQHNIMEDLQHIAEEGQLDL